MSQTKAIVETIALPVDQIKPSPYQPRLSFDLEDIRGSIQRDGILVPLTVRKKNGYYELIDGERRLRLAIELGNKTVPCTVIDVDDDTARRTVWKVNTLRQDYTPKEKAFHFRKLQEKYGMSLRGMAMEYGIDRHTIKAYLNTFRLPDEYQQMVWARVIPIGVIKELEVLFNSGVYPPSGKLTAEEAPEIFEILDRAAREKYFGQKQAQETIRPYLKKLREEQVEKAKTVIEKVEPEVKVPETPEELEEAAMILRREAERRKTPEQKHQELVDKAQRALNTFPSLEKAEELGVDIKPYKEELEEIASYSKRSPKEALNVTNTLKRKLNAETKEARKRKEEAERKQREAKIRKRVEEEARRAAEEKLLKDKEFLRRAAELAPPIIERPTREEVPFEFEPSPEQIEAIREQLKEGEERLQAILDRPDVKERGKLFENWVAHNALLSVLGSARCPICDANWESLTWKCHGLNIKDAYDLLTDKYQKAVRRGGKK